MAKATKAVSRARATRKASRATTITLTLTDEAREVVARYRAMAEVKRAYFKTDLTRRHKAYKELRAKREAARAEYEQFVTAIVERIARYRNPAQLAKARGELVTLAVIHYLGGSGNACPHHAITSAIVDAVGIRDAGSDWQERGLELPKAGRS